MLRRFFDSLVLEYPRAVLCGVALLVGWLGYEARLLEVDASAETLMLEDDRDLHYSRIINNRFGSQEFLVITYTPHRDDLLSDDVLGRIKRLKDDLLKLELVDSVNSLIDVPLLESPPKPVKELLRNIPTLESPDVDRKLARREFLNSPIYHNLLVSPDFKTTALQVNLKEDEEFRDFIFRRNELRYLEKTAELTPEQGEELSRLLRDFKSHRAVMREQQHENIVQVRAVMENYRADADLFLGGVNMIADDLITYIKNDLGVFGLGVLIFLIITLKIIFRQWRWILVPLLTCSFSVVATCGLLGIFSWEVTVISSNFIAIQLIITMAITIHLIVRYRELCQQRPDDERRDLILDATLFMAKPCTFAILTTVAGFSSLVLSDILPVINFGWMMSAGITISLLLTFLIFPAIVRLLKPVHPDTSFESHFALTRKLADYTEGHGDKILGLSALLLVVSLVGSSRLVVENSFIDYFKESTEIYRGMKVIDQQLGGTTPLDVILDFEPEEETVLAASAESDEFDDVFDDFEEEFEASKGEAQYWFTAEKMEEIERIHDYLDGLPQTGKVISLGTMLKVGRTLNDGESLDNFKLALIYNELPEKFRKILLAPYVSVEDNQVRFFVRVRDSEPGLRRNELLRQIKNDLTDKLGFKAERTHLTGLLVLYNNMLQSLFSSQIMTLGAVVAVLMAMFLILFRSLTVAAIAIFPNILSVGVVLGFMGWIGIPLDMMTITIAAISVGIAVDDTIHYIHRFKREFRKDGDYIATMHRCHESIGYAMYYTSLIIVIGFSILVLSNFMPTIYFGLLTGLAMVIALVSALTLLPQLIIRLKPFGSEYNSQSADET